LGNFKKGGEILKKILKKVSLPLYKAAGLGALCACLLWPVVVLLQGQFVWGLMDRSFVEGQDLSQILQILFDRVTETDMPLVYDLPHLSGALILVPFLVLFALACFFSKDSGTAKRRSCLLAGVGLQCYAALAFASNIVFAAALYYKEWSAGMSHSVIMRVLFTAFGSGISELVSISFFALALLITGYTGKVRPLAVSTGAICFYKLFEDSLWLLTGAFDGTLTSASPLQVAHGIVFLVAFSLTFGPAVLVAMGSCGEEREEVAACS
jgi:hypothetical protein